MTWEVNASASWRKRMRENCHQSSGVSFFGTSSSSPSSSLAAVCSSSLRASSVDEEDELFLNEHMQEEGEGEGHDDGDTLSNSGCGGRDSRSVSTPSTNNNAPLPGGETEPEGWLDDMDAVEEAEQFDEVDPVRLMDDERRQRQRGQICVSGLDQKDWALHRGSRKGV